MNKIVSLRQKFGRKNSSSSTSQSSASVDHNIAPCKILHIKERKRNGSMKYYSRDDPDVSTDHFIPKIKIIRIRNFFFHLISVKRCLQILQPVWRCKIDSSRMQNQQFISLWLFCCWICGWGNCGQIVNETSFQNRWKYIQSEIRQHRPPIII